MRVLRRPLVGGLLLLLVVAVGAGVAFGPIGVGTQAPLAQRLHDAVDVQAILDDMATLQGIADENGGVRAGGTQGQLASAAFVAAVLREAGYRVTVDTFALPLFTEVGTPTISAGSRTYVSGVDFRPMIFSASGHLSARLEAVGFDTSPGPLSAPGAGCGENDFAAVPRAAVLLVRGGGCASRDIVDNAVAAGARGLIISYPAWQPGAVLRPTLRSPDVTIPVIGTTWQMGLALNEVAAANGQVTLNVETSIVDRPSANVVAETPDGDPDHVIMLGGHLDSVIDGPGINDNGSGTMTVLEIAREAIRMHPDRKIRVGFWTGEEIGLYGSFRYVNSLAFEERRAIEAYLNFDMLGSPNGGRIIYDDVAARTGSSVIRDQFAAYFAGIGLGTETEDLGGASDHYAFQRGSIPTGGLFSGATTAMTDAEAQLFGGEAGVPFDACYHLTCDTSDNVNPELLRQMAQAAAYVTGRLASGEVSVRE
jgi:Zn-dependent M28 family amino/carboxypeptidase